MSKLNKTAQAATLTKVTIVNVLTKAETNKYSTCNDYAKQSRTTKNYN